MKNATLIKFHFANSVLLNRLDLGEERFCCCVTSVSQVSNTRFQSANMVTKKIKWSEVNVFLTKIIQQLVDIIRKTIGSNYSPYDCYARPQDKPQFVFKSCYSPVQGRDAALNSLQNLLQVCEHHMASTWHLQMSLLTSG